MSEDPDDLDALIERARAGDDAALGRLLERYRAYLTVLARVQIGRRLQGKADCADVVQETFLEAARHFAGFRGSTEAELAAWLRQILAEFGWDVANRLSVEVADEATPLLAEGYRRKFGLEGEGAALVSQVMQTEFLGEGSDVDLIHEDRDSAEVDINCTFGAMLQKPKFGRLPVTDGLCEGGCRGWAGDIARSVDPELRGRDRAGSKRLLVVRTAQVDRASTTSDQPRAHGLHEVGIRRAVLVDVLHREPALRRADAPVRELEHERLRARVRSQPRRAIGLTQRPMLPRLPLLRWLGHQPIS